ncbi:Triosephosphate isomerase [Thalassovita gelatinovora]|uniref:Triosephosphate isomerase n=1 Tax=Thalassovita gelatinovora TaxID=53501 RepID=A0A0P1G092_THAGE|nr:triose-phosphate isomerase [Thalassovita gelatinovora]QIZ79717.1 triose-phosphate isomerase [Thalassovita gelatinovora]CUH66699.1 Triosephosphate isomerase [Thalassovita gelatinovora]SEQ41248.1 triosephosphate isomerase [Thalassovita gelatinovora]
MRRKLAAGNWKMNGLKAELDQIDALTERHADSPIDLLICPPATLIAAAVSRVANDAMMIGGQDCHSEVSGAFTGDISAAMLADAGAGAVILGHSERRELHQESDELIRAKAVMAHQSGLITVVCVGESLAQREAASTLDIIAAQLAASVPDGATGENMVIAYEPIWAIGTGKVPTLNQIGEVHDFIRARLEQRFGTAAGQSIRLLYGGSVKPDNAAGIFTVPNVDGALVGGASLTAADFSPIIEALKAAVS